MGKGPDGELLVRFGTAGPFLTTGRVPAASTIRGVESNSWPQGKACPAERNPWWKGFVRPAVSGRHRIWQEGPAAHPAPLAAELRTRRGRLPLLPESGGLNNPAKLLKPASKGPPARRCAVGCFLLCGLDSAACAWRL